jgi:hypothetical protein
MFASTSSGDPLFVASLVSRSIRCRGLRLALAFRETFRLCPVPQLRAETSRPPFTPPVRGREVVKLGAQSRCGVALLSLGLAAANATAAASAAPLNLNLNRALQIGWYSLRVQNPFGTNFNGLTAIKSYNPSAKQFVFLDSKGQDVVIKEEDISFIYFRQLPERSDVNVRDGAIRNIQITPYREFLYNINPGRLAIQDGNLLLDTRWRIAEQKPFDVNTTPPAVQEGSRLEQIEIPRRIQLNYLGNHYLVETEFVNVVIGDRPLPGAGTVPQPIQSTIKQVPPSLSLSP